jgi:hypothetical protein
MPDLLAEFLQRVPVMRLQLVAILRQQARPIESPWERRRLVERRTRLLIRHLQEQQNVNCST